MHDEVGVEVGGGVEQLEDEALHLPLSEERRRRGRGGGGGEGEVTVDEGGDVVWTVLEHEEDGVGSTPHGDAVQADDVGVVQGLEQLNLTDRGQRELRRRGGEEATRVRIGQVGGVRGQACMCDGSDSCLLLHHADLLQGDDLSGHFVLRSI